MSNSFSCEKGIFPFLFLPFLLYCILYLILVLTTSLFLFLYFSHLIVTFFNYQISTVELLLQNGAGIHTVLLLFVLLFFCSFVLLFFCSFVLLFFCLFFLFFFPLLFSSDVMDRYQLCLPRVRDTTSSCLPDLPPRRC